MSARARLPIGRGCRRSAATSGPSPSNSERARRRRCCPRRGRARTAGTAAGLAPLPACAEPEPGPLPPLRLRRRVPGAAAARGRSCSCSTTSTGPTGVVALLEFLARELEGARLLIVGTFRDVELARGHPLGPTLAELTRERLFERVLLRGLDRTTSNASSSVGALSPRARRRCSAQTEGNPLFVTEIVRLLAQEGPSRPNGRRTAETGARVPEGVREVIGRRLDRLPSVARRSAPSPR